jgi:hypothetical protein
MKNKTLGVFRNLGFSEDITNFYLAKDYSIFNYFNSLFLHENSISPMTYFHSFTDSKFILGSRQNSDNIIKPNSNKQDLLSRRFTPANQVLSGKNSLGYSYVNEFNKSDFGKNPIEGHRKYFSGYLAETLKQIGVPNIEIDDSASTITSSGEVVASHTIRRKGNVVIVHGLLTISPFDLSEFKDDFYFGTRLFGGRKFLLENILEQSKSVQDLLVGNLSERVLKDSFVSTFNNLFVKDSIDLGSKMITPTSNQISYFSNSNWILNGKSSNINLSGETPNESNELSNTCNQYCFFSQVLESYFDRYL